MANVNKTMKILPYLSGLKQIGCLSNEEYTAIYNFFKSHMRDEVSYEGIIPKLIQIRQNVDETAKSLLDNIIDLCR